MIKGQRKIYWALKFAGLTDIDDYTEDELYEAFAAYQEFGKEIQKGGRP